MPLTGAHVSFSGVICTPTIYKQEWQISLCPENQTWGLIHYPHPRALSLTHIPTFWRRLSLRGCIPNQTKSQLKPENFTHIKIRQGCTSQPHPFGLPHTSRWAPGNPVQPRPKNSINAQTCRHSEILGHSIAFNVSPTER